MTTLKNKQHPIVRMLDISIVKKYIRTADDGWHQGWHERNGGNLTYRLKAEEVAEIWVLQKSTGLPELQTIQDDELRAIARDFKVNLREDFLD